MSFPAKFEGGFCPAGCGSRIHEGDLIELVDGEYVHVDCKPKDPMVLGPGEVVCPDCWMIRPCGCVE